MPTKALLHAAELRHGIEAARSWGIHTGSIRVHLDELFQQKDRLIGEFAAYRVNQLKSGPFDFIRGNARFINPQTILLDDSQELRAKHFVIATGSEIAPLPLPELGKIQCLTSDSALKLKSLPESLIVLGGGAVGLEFAQFFSRLGVRVSLLQRSKQLLRGFDADAADELKKALELEGIEVWTNTRLIGADLIQGQKWVRFEQNGKVYELAAEEIFHGLGRRPNTQSLNLEAAGVSCRGSGQIVIKPTQQTTAPNIYAAGDCCGPHEIVHIAIQQGELAATNLLNPGKPKERDDRLLTRVVFTEPAVAHVGITEAEAAGTGLEVRSASYPFNDHGKSMILGCRHGFVKLIAHPATGEILGATCVGPQAGELIHEIVVAMAARMTVFSFAAIPHYHPTLAEIWLYPAEEIAEQISHPEATP